MAVLLAVLLRSGTPGPIWPHAASSSCCICGAFHPSSDGASVATVGAGIGSGIGGGVTGSASMLSRYCDLRTSVTLWSRKGLCLFSPNLFSNFAFARINVPPGLALPLEGTPWQGNVPY